jgi:hypothetical protein
VESLDAVLTEGSGYDVEKPSHVLGKQRAIDGTRCLGRTSL